MKNIKEFNINPEKLIKNDELLNLKGGAGGCGEGFTQMECMWAPDMSSAWIGPAIVCEGPGQDACEMMRDMYLSDFPDMIVVCANNIIVN